MAENIINIATLEINSEKAIDAVAKTKKELFDLQGQNTALRKTIKDLGDDSGELTKKFVQNEATIKTLNTSYREQSASLNALTLAQVKETDALNQSAKTIAQAEQQNKALLEIKKQVNATTPEGVKAMQLLNDKMDENTKFIKANDNEDQKRLSNIGKYPQVMAGVGNAFGGAAQQVIGFAQKGKDVVSSLGEVNNLVTNSVKNIVGFGNASKLAAVQTATLGASGTVAGAGTQVASTGMNVATKSTWALNIAMGTLLLPITAIVAVVALALYGFSKFQPVVEKVEQVVAGLGAAFTVLTNGIVAVVTGARSLGDVFSSLGGDMTSAANDTMKLVEAQQNLEETMQQQEVSVAKQRAEINKLNVELKNRTKTEKERLAIAEEIDQKENALFNQRKKSVNEEIQQAKEAIRIKAQLSEGEKGVLDKGLKDIRNFSEGKKISIDDELEVLKTARLKAIEIENEATVNLEKNQTKKDKLEDDASSKNEARKQKEIAQAEKSRQQMEADLRNRIDIFKLEAKENDVTADQKLATAQRVFEMENELAKKSSSGLEEQKKIIENRQALSAEILAITEDGITAEIEAQKISFEEKKNISEQEKTDLIANADFLKSEQIRAVDESLMIASEKAKAKAEIEKGYLDNVAVLNQNYKDSQKEIDDLALQELEALKDIQFEMKILRMEEEHASEFAIKQAQIDQDYAQKIAQLDADLAANKKNAGEVRALKELEDKKYKVATDSIDKAQKSSKIKMLADLVQESLKAAEAIFGESKAMSVAMALIDTYKGITAGVALGFPMSIPAVAMAAATGFATVKKILSTNKGSSGGSAPSTGTASGTTAGVQTFENPARTSTIANITPPPAIPLAPTNTPVLVVESLREVQNNTQIKVDSE